MSALNDRYGPLRRAAAQAAPRRRRIVLAVVLGTAAVTASMGLLAASGYLIVRASEQPPVLQLSTVIVMVRFFGTSRAVLRYAERLISHDLAFRQLADLRTAFFEKLIPLVPGSLGSVRGADLLSRFVADVDRLQDLYLRVLLPPLIAVGTMVVAGVTAGVVSPLAGAVLAAAMLLGATAVPWAVSAVARSAGRRQQAVRAELATEFVESIDGSAELALLGRSQERLSRLQAIDDELSRLIRRDAVAGGLATALGSVVSGLGLIGVLLAVVPEVAGGGLRAPLLGLAALLALAAFEAISTLPAAAQQLAACGAAATRIEEITEMPVLVPEPHDPVGFPEDEPVVAARGVTVSGILDRVDIELRPGRAVALVGPSGSGKTTLARLLVRFADPDAGAVTASGIDVRRLAQDELRGNVLLCAQDAHLFTTTIGENVRLARRDATDDELLAALEAAGLGDFVRALPDGLDTLVGEDGAQLSGGQRRRLIAARGVVSGARVVIFDEPAAHLDPVGAEAIHRRLCAEREHDRAVLVIAHALTGLDCFDEVVVLDGGAVAERGRHAELVAAGGRYAELTRDQAAALGRPPSTGTIDA